MITITQGDTAVLNLSATNGDDIPVDLTGAVFTTSIQGPQGEVVTFPDDQHTANPNQVTNRGKFILTLSSADTASLSAAPNKEIVTKIVIGATQIYYHGVNALTVLLAIPVQ